MEIVFRHVPRRPDVSIVLLDWSVRESFHSIDYLNQQTVARDRYELIWIEYGDRRADGVERRLRDSLERSRHPAVDCWMTLGMPSSIYYHKHLAYNVGILAAAGRIVVFCDSDAIFREAFVESIIRSFDDDPNIVLHHDEIRNNRKDFYPFNYPSIREIEREGCINLVDGRPAGIPVPGGTVEDLLHVANYGACMAALRSDLIAIGGADEHVDYLGHICGPYDMTFRLRNLGRREIWHGSEWIYHVWHPGQAGDGNYLGPHDGRHMSTTALDALATGRVMPLVENPGIRALREARAGGLLWEPPLVQAVAGGELEGWKLERIDAQLAGMAFQSTKGFEVPLTPQRRRIALTIRAVVDAVKSRLASRQPANVRRLTRGVTGIDDLMRRAVKFVRRGARAVRTLYREVDGRVTMWDHRVRQLADEGVREVAIVGVSEMVHILAEACRKTGIEPRILAIDEGMTAGVVREEPIDVLVGSLYGGTHWAQLVSRAGVRPSRLIAVDGEMDLAPSRPVHLPPSGTSPDLTMILGPLLSVDETRDWLQHLADTARNPAAIEVLVCAEVSAETLTGCAKLLRIRSLTKLSGATLAARIADGVTLANGRIVAVLFEPVQFATRGWDAAIWWTLDSQRENPALLRTGIDVHNHEIASLLALPRQLLREVPGLISESYQTSQLGSHMYDVFRRAAALRPVRIIDQPEVGLRRRAETVDPVVDRMAWLLQSDDREFAARALARVVPIRDEKRAGGMAAVRTARLGEAPRGLAGGAPRLSIVMVTTSPEVDAISFDALMRSEPEVDAEWLLAAAVDGMSLADICNIAAREASGRHLVFVERNIEPEAGALGRLERFLAREPDVAAVSGPVLERRSGRVVAAGLALHEEGDRVRVVPLHRGVAATDTRLTERQEATLMPLLGLCVDRVRFVDAGGLQDGHGDAASLGAALCLQLLANKQRLVLLPEVRWLIDDPRRLGDATSNRIATAFPFGDRIGAAPKLTARLEAERAERVHMGDVDVVLASPDAGTEAEARAARRKTMLLAWLSSLEDDGLREFALRLAPTGRLENVEIPLGEWRLPSNVR